MSAWLPVAPCTPGDCAHHEGAVRAPLPAVALLLAGCAVTLLGVLCVPAVLLMGPSHRDRLTRRWAYAVVRAFGVRVRVTGASVARTRPPSGELVVANHVSWLDIPLVAAVLPARMVAKHEIRNWPVLGPMAALGGTLFIERDRLRAATQAENRQVMGAAEAEAEAARLAVYRDADPAVLLALAAQALAARLPQIGQLNLTPDMVTGALARLSAPREER